MKFENATVVVSSASATCTGTADPVISAPQCYHAKAGALGLTETVGVTINDFASGHFGIAGSSAEGFSCAGKDFSKYVRNMTTDLRDCVPSAVSPSGMDYCPDQDAFKMKVQMTVKIEGVPITNSVNNVDCAVEKQSGSVIMWEEFATKLAKNGNDSERKAIFLQNIDCILDTHRKQDVYWFDVTEFAEMTPEEFQAASGHGNMSVRQCGILSGVTCTGSADPVIFAPQFYHAIAGAFDCVPGPHNFCHELTAQALLWRYEPTLAIIG